MTTGRINQNAAYAAAAAAAVALSLFSRQHRHTGDRKTTGIAQEPCPEEYPWAARAPHTASQREREAEPPRRERESAPRPRKQPAGRLGWAAEKPPPGPATREVASDRRGGGKRGKSLRLLDPAERKTVVHRVLGRQLDGARGRPLLETGQALPAGADAARRQARRRPPVAVGRRTHTTFCGPWERRAARTRKQACKRLAVCGPAWQDAPPARKPP